MKSPTNILRLANTVRQNMQTEKLVNSNDLLITLSGGQDSAFCVLVLYLLNKQMIKEWNRQKVLNLSDSYNKEKTLIKQAFNYNLFLNDWGHKKVVTKLNVLKKLNRNKVFFNVTTFLTGKQNMFCLSQTRALFLSPTQFLLKRDLNKSQERFNQDFNLFIETRQRIFVTSVEENYLFLKHDLVKTLLYRSLSPVTYLHRNTHGFLISTDELRKRSFVQSFLTKRGADVKQNYVFLEEDKTLFKRITELIDNYTLLWCNHFWQRDAFFTMEHVFKLTFSKNYRMYSFAPVKKILSEQNARHWRHKVMQRLSIFLLKCDCHLVELSFKYVFVTTPSLLTRLKQEYGLCQTRFGNEHEKQSKTFGKSQPLKNKLTGRTFVANNNYLYRFQLCNQNVIAEGRNSKNRSHLSKPLRRLALLEQKQSLLKKRFFKRYSQASVSCLSEQLCVQGHNKSDRAEAILFNLMRGTGMSGLSTLQWKHTFFSPSNSNSKFYPIFFDFFKEIRIVCLNSLFLKLSSLQKETIQRDRSVFLLNVLKKLNKNEVVKKNKVFFNVTTFFNVKPVKFVRRNRNEITKSNLKNIANFKQSGLMVFSRNFTAKTRKKHNETRVNFVVDKASENLFALSQKQIKPLYYQLKYNKNT